MMQEIQFCDITWFGNLGSMLLRIKNHISVVGPEVLIVATTKSAGFWDVTPYSLVKVHQLFRGTYCLHPEGQRASHATSKSKP
jgi:hypothetical protein